MALRAVLLLIGPILALQSHARQAATAGPAAAEEADPWLIKATLGYLATSGNTESSSLNSGFSIAYDDDGFWLHALDAGAINSTEEGQTTAEAYAVGWKSEYSLTDSDFLFARINWRKDRFSGYEQQLSETLGYGRRLIDTGTHVLNAEIGAGARQAELADGSMEDEFIGRGGLNYLWKFSETAEFTQILAVESGADNTYLESVSALKASLVGDLALVASYTIRNNSSVPAGSEETDTFTALSLEYLF
jgi:putative salt-induced outer membrane protein